MRLLFKKNVAIHFWQLVVLHVHTLPRPIAKKVLIRYGMIGAHSLFLPHDKVKTEGWIFFMLLIIYWEPNKHKLNCIYNTIWENIITTVLVKRLWKGD